MTSSLQEAIAIRAPPWMLQPLNSSQYQDLMEVIKDENRRQKLGKKAVLGGVASTISVGVLGHCYMTTSHGAGGCSMLQEWYEGLDDELTKLIKCTVLAAYQVEEIGALKTLHQVAVNGIGHGIVHPVVEEFVQQSLPLDNLLEAGLAEVAGIGLVQGYFIANDIRRCRKGEMTTDERNVSISRRVGITAGAAAGQTVAAPVGTFAFYTTGGLIMAAGAAFTPALVGAVVIGGTVWLASTIVGGVLGARAGQGLYRKVRPENRSKDAQDYFGVDFQDVDDDRKGLRMVYFSKVDELERKNGDPNTKDYQLSMVQCNMHLAWLLESKYPGTLDALGIVRKESEKRIKSKSEEKKSKKERKEWRANGAWMRK
jgi:VIT1/CCC1 family predicted Fe2+/Mn2+ transporter